MKMFYYNPLLDTFKHPVGAVQVYKDILIRLHVDKKVDLKNIRLIMKDDYEKVLFKSDLNISSTDIKYNYYEIVFQIPYVGLYWYYFEVNDGQYFLGSNEMFEMIKVNKHPKYWPLLIHYAFSNNLSWFKGKIMYQIFVDRFFKGGNNPVKEGTIIHKSWDELVAYKPVNGLILNNDFFGGDLEGIRQKLDYLKDLNVGIIYLNPIFEAQSNHKYDTGDYLKIDPMFGTEDDLIKLIKQSNDYGIKLILDGVFNHTGDNSIYFNKSGSYPSIGACQSPSSPYYTWYRFINYPDEYESWWGFYSLPSVNQHSKSFLDFITGKGGVIDKWLTLGIKGFRIDVIDELNDNFINLINRAIKRVSDDNIIIGEVWEEAVTKISYGNRRRYFQGYQIDSVMNYPLKDAIFAYIKYNDILRLKIQIRELINNYPKHILDLLMNLLGTHDTIRLINNFTYTSGDDLSKDLQAHYVMRDDELAKAIVNLKLATALQFTLPGVPCIYYGDEIGMQGFRDPFCRGTFKWDNINPDILDWYKKLSCIRMNYDCFIEGIYQEEIIENNIFSFSRIGKDYKILVIINNNDYKINYKINQGLDLIENKMVFEQIIIPAKTAKVIKIDLG